MAVFKVCLICESGFSVINAREHSAKYCSRKCSDQAKVSEANTDCSNCGKSFHMKNSQKKRYKRSLGYFCSVECSAVFKSRAYLDEEDYDICLINFNDTIEVVKSVLNEM